MIEYAGIDEVMEILEDELKTLESLRDFYQYSPLALFYKGKHVAVQDLIAKLKAKYENS